MKLITVGRFRFLAYGLSVPDCRDTLLLNTATVIGWPRDAGANSSFHLGHNGLILRNLCSAPETRDWTRKDANMGRSSILLLLDAKNTVSDLGSDDK